MITTSQSWLRIAGALAGLAVVAIALIEGMARWDAASVVSLWLLAIAVAFVFWAPTLMESSPASGDAVPMAMIGSLFAQAIVLLVLAGIALLIARNEGSRTTVWIIDVLYVAVLLIAMALRRAAAPIIESAAARPRPPEPPAPADENW